MPRLPVLTAVWLTAASACVTAQTPQNRLTEAERAGGWRLLFDGQTLDGWRGFRSDDLPAGWIAREGALIREAAGGDLVTREQFADFELSLEWKVRAGGNSGVFFRVSEDADRTFESGPEMQVLDDAGHADGQSPLTSAGANYGLHAVARGIVRPAREWNHARIVAEGAHIEHWLNGVPVVSYELWSPEWEALVAESKFAEWPEYGRATRGHIALQDHGDWVAYRNIKIRPLP